MDGARETLEAALAGSIDKSCSFCAAALSARARTRRLLPNLNRISLGKNT